MLFYLTAKRGQIGPLITMLFYEIYLIFIKERFN
jgi:hypothetical protein